MGWIAFGLLWALGAAADARAVAKVSPREAAVIFALWPVFAILYLLEGDRG